MLNLHTGFLHWNGNHGSADQGPSLRRFHPVCAIARALVKILRDPAKRHAQEPGDMVCTYRCVGDLTRSKVLMVRNISLFIIDDCTRYTVVHGARDSIENISYLSNSSRRRTTSLFDATASITNSNADRLANDVTPTLLPENKTH